MVIEKMNQYMNLPVSHETWKKMNTRKNPHDTFDDVVIGLLEIAEKSEGKNAE